MEETGDRHYAAETHRMRGVVLLQHKTPSAEQEAEGAFRDALHIARQQHAKSFELRVAISWGQELIKTNRPDEAKRLLGRIYSGQFTEGTDTIDHQEARTLLQQLS